MNSGKPLTTSPPSQPRGRMAYVPGLDGLRALAVIAVLGYHAGLDVRGGFLGVESFFVLSGFLITSLLYAEWQSTGRIDLADFWRRRALRLLPALFLVIAAVLGVAMLLPRQETEGLGRDVLAALGYIMNWHLVWSERPYFDPTMQPPLLQHLWSLAVEEQFYILWPVLFVLGMRFLRARGFLVAILAAALGSAALMASMFQPGADPSRMYYGTDTRAAGLLLGAALALVWVQGRIPWADSRRAGVVFDVVGLLALGALAASYALVYDYLPLLYRGGFTVVALITAVVIAAVAHPGARLVPRVLGWSPLRWVGIRSYGIYLWHWPVFTLTQAYGLPLDERLSLVVQICIVVALAALSYRYVEMPIRRGALSPVWRTFKQMLDVSSAAYASVLRRNRSLARKGRNGVVVTLMLVTAACASTSGTALPPATEASAAAVAETLAPTLSLATEAPTLEPTIAASETPEASPTLEASPTSAATNTPEPSATPTETPQPALQPFDPALAAELQRILDQTVADGYIPGTVLSVSILGQEPWYGSSGVADRRQGIAMEPDTRVRIASISKIFTSVAVLQLVQDGVIDLDAPLSTYLPDLLPNGDAITIRMLLNHTTGLYDYLEDRNFVNRAYETPDRVWEPRELVEYAIQFPPSFQAGAEGSWDYSSTNYVILGMVVEQVTGNTLAQQLRQGVFEPAGLESTYFAPNEEIQGNRARGYSRTVDQTNITMSLVFGTASIVSTVGDVRQFMNALVGGELLSPEMLAEMYEFVNGNGQYNMPELEYGLGLMRSRLYVGPGPDGQERPAEASRVVGHIGGFGGFRSATWSAPESGITIALGVNQAATDPNILATQVFDAILTAQGR